MGLDTKSEAGSTRASELKRAIQSNGNIPRHIAIIMDGNGRWAKERGFQRIQGHQAGRKPVREVVEAATELGVGVVTLYTFSIENWNRPKAEVAALMRFLTQTLRDERDELKQNGVRLTTIGRIEDLPGAVRDELASTVAFLSGGERLRLTLALSYGGRAELVDAMRSMGREIQRGELSPESIDESTIERHLYTHDMPSPDLLIRTSGEMRISNFLLWQLAYSEIYVTDDYWPDFRREHFYEAILNYQSRERRFGRVD